MAQFLNSALGLSMLLFLANALPVEDKIASSGATETLFPTNIGFGGATSTAAAPFLLQTDFAGAVTGTQTTQHMYPNPIETSVQSFDHSPKDKNIYEMFGTLSPYFVSEEGWGVYNYGMPEQCRIEQVHFLQRHGSRYPDSSFNFPIKLKNHTYNASGDLKFLNDWQLKMGVNLLTNLGNNQLFSNGVKDFFRYGQLFDFEGGEKIVARTASQDRIFKTAEYFLTGFFGFEWQKYVDLEVIIEDDGFNNTLAPWNDCTNNAYSYNKIKYPEMDGYKKKYLKDAVKRFNSQIDGYTFSHDDLFEIQKICAYETNILGASHFCPLFSTEEWENYEYYITVDWYAENSFGNPMGRALGVGWVEEFSNRLTNTTYNASHQAEQNSTLDSNPIYFPLGQNFYMDFTHDSSIHNIITALGFEQFKTNWTFTGPESDTHMYDLAKITPFAAQLNFEIIECDEEVPSDRGSASKEGTSSVKYIHAMLNDNTLSLSENIPEFCETRIDGWCDLNKFIEYLGSLNDAAEYEYSCNGKYDYTKTVFNGVPN